MTRPSRIYVRLPVAVTLQLKWDTPQREEILEVFENALPLDEIQGIARVSVDEFLKGRTDFLRGGDE